MFSNFVTNNPPKYNLRLLPEFNQLQNIKFLDGARGFAVGPNPNNSASLFTKTINSGITWSDPVQISGLTVVNEVNFLNSNIGFACGQAGSTAIVARTLDGGDTWSATSVVNASSPFIYHTIFSDNVNFGIGVGKTGTTTGGMGMVTRTFNSGDTWTTCTGITGTRELRTTAYISGGTFIAVGTNTSQLGCVLRSTDSGNTWSIVKSFLSSEARKLVDLCFLDNLTGYTVGYNGTSSINGSAVCSKTTNGGSTWSTPVVITGMSAAWGVNFIDVNNGIAVGWNSSLVGTVAITTDGGSTWESMQLKQTSFLYYPTSVNGRFWIVGENATQGFIIYKTDIIP